MRDFSIVLLHVINVFNTTSNNPIVLIQKMLLKIESFTDFFTLSMLIYHVWLLNRQQRTNISKTTSNSLDMASGVQRKIIFLIWIPFRVFRVLLYSMIWKNGIIKEKYLTTETLRSFTIFIVLLPKSPELTLKADSSLFQLAWYTYTLCVSHMCITLPPVHMYRR